MDYLKNDDDAGELLAFCQEMIRTSYSPAYPPEVVELFLRYHSRGSLAADISSGRVWAAREAGRIVGTVTVAGGELSRMFVHPAMRGRGVGAALARLALDYARETGLRKLTAWSVPFSRGFYEKLGFRVLNADVWNFDNTRDPAVPYLEMALWPQGAPELSIGRAGEEDAEELLAGQRLAFEEQCRLYGDWEIPPMKETPDDFLRYTNAGGTVLKAESFGRIIGAVRGKLEDGLCHVGRLWVLPAWQGKSAGRMLVSAVEQACCECRAFSIFTGERSGRNLSLYMRQGYGPTGRWAPAKPPGSAGNHDLVWLEKPNPWPAVLECARRFRP